MSGSPTVVQVNGCSPGAGVGSTFGGSARSMARTQSVCCPEARPSSIHTASHGCQVAVASDGWSSAHSNSSTCSSAAKPKITSGPELSTAGWTTMNVSGGVVSGGPMISHS